MEDPPWKLAPRGSRLVRPRREPRPGHHGGTRHSLPLGLGGSVRPDPPRLAFVPHRRVVLALRRVRETSIDAGRRVAVGPALPIPGSCDRGGPEVEVDPGRGAVWKCRPRADEQTLGRGSHAGSGATAHRRGAVRLGATPGIRAPADAARSLAHGRRTLRRVAATAPHRGAQGRREFRSGKRAARVRGSPAHHLGN